MDLQSYILKDCVILCTDKPQRNILFVEKKIACRGALKHVYCCTSDSKINKNTDACVTRPRQRRVRVPVSAVRLASGARVCLDVVLFMSFISHRHFNRTSTI